MVSNIFKVLVALFLLTFCVNHSQSKLNPNIFSIIDESTLQRKLEFSPINDTLTIFESSSIQNGSKLLHYLSLVSEEMNEISRTEEQGIKEDPILLPSAYMELSADEVKFHEINFDDFVNFKKAPVRLETIIPDGSDQNTIKIIYESKITEIVLSGLAEINGTNCDFFLNVTDLTLREEHERTPVPVGKIVTKSILETLSLKKFSMLIVLTEGNKFIRSPNRQILRRLADSWLVKIVDTVNSRFVQPKIIEQSQLYFRNYKKAFLEAGCSTVKEAFVAVSGSISSFEDKNIRPEDSGGGSYYKYSFENINFSNFSNISYNCSCGSFSVQIEKTRNPDDNYYSHDLIFAFTYSSNKKFVYPAVLSWTQKRVSNNYYALGTLEQRISSTVRLWSLRLTLFTDKNGRKTDDDMRVDIDFELEENGSTKLSDWSYRFLEDLKNKMALSLRDKLLLLFQSPAETAVI